MKNNKEKKQSWLALLIYGIMLVIVLAFIFSSIIKSFG